MKTSFANPTIAFLSLLVFLFTSCSNPVRQPIKTHRYSDDSFQQLVLGMDTLPYPRRIAKIDSVVARQIWKNNNQLVKNYFGGYKYALLNNDSALLYFTQMHPDSSQYNWVVLKQYRIMAQSLQPAKAIESGQAQEILKQIDFAEKHNSLFTYYLYDLMARIYYQNDNPEKSKQYAALYYKTHPFSNTVFIRQRYFDLSFLLAVRMQDTVAMRQSLDSSRLLAMSIKDSTALMRSYENEAQLLSRTGQYAKAVATNRVFIQYMASHAGLRAFMLGNFAINFRRNQQTDSAIYYTKAAIELANKNEPNANLKNLYNELHELLKQKGDYKAALEALDSSVQITTRNIEKIQADKIEEIHTRYQTEKKDLAIASLQTTDTLHKKIIKQQQWIFAGIALLCVALVLFFYDNYRRRMLKEKNEKLEIENKRLLLEQKTRQQQLDPHFIYNAISNLQGLISSDKKEEANAYLIAFSKLMRHSLELNRHDLVSLQDEISLLENYIKLQQMRFENKFTYNIDINIADNDSILLPPMLLQPFVENAIEHGFKNIDYAGHLTIRFAEEQNKMHIAVVDNGKGLQADVEKNTGKKSLSGIITQERLDLLFNAKSKEAWFTVASNSSQANGVQVNIFLPIQTA